MHSPEEKKKCETFDALVERIWGTSTNPPTVTEAEEEWEEDEDYEGEPITIPEIEYTVNANGCLINQYTMYDKLINAEVKLQLGENIQTDKLVKRAIGPDGVTVGVYDDNPKLNCIIYDAKFLDGKVRDYFANIIAENMLTQVNPDELSLTTMGGGLSTTRRMKLQRCRRHTCMSCPGAVKIEYERLLAAGSSK